MAQYDYDLFVIGAGSGGVRAARTAAAKGHKVGIAEDRYLGGTCVNVGCVPKKLLVMAAQFADGFADAQGFGWQVGETAFDWSRLIANKDKEIKRLNGVYSKLLDGSGVETLWGRATLTGPHEVEIEGKKVSAEHILIATGGWPVVPEIEGSELAITSNEAFHLEQLPKRVVIVGGGYIAVEFAGIFNGLGASVTQLYRGEMFLRGFDDDLRPALAGEMKSRGVDLRFNINATRIEKRDDGLCVHLTDGSQVIADVVMFATGRAANTSGLGLEAVGIDMDEKGAVKVDDYFQTSVPSIYALGDVIDRVQLTPVAIAEAMVLVQNLFGEGEKLSMDYADIPTAVFSQPPIGTIGLTEAQALARGEEVDIYLSQFKPMKYTLAGRDEKVVMKLIVERKSDRVIGCHMLGADGPEIIQGLAVAMKCGATKAQFDATIGIHPSTAEEFVTLRDKKN
ncbi:MAG: glutathione-disulfide reductase [Rhodospirillaceae bacterium]|nr:glutathione-disulfide reductase [Rhodospirillaceae bacterium]